MIQFTEIKSHYRTGKDDLSQDFFIPCLQFCHQYRRAVGYFSSGALIAWCEAIPYLLTHNATIKLIISPELSAEDKNAIASATDPAQITKLRQICADQIIQNALKLSQNFQEIELKQQLLAWMIANEKLILKFAFPEHINQAGIFHEKIGIFDFPSGETVAFTGSANESFGGYQKNYESIDVYRSWIEADIERVKTKIEIFEETWANQSQGLAVIPLSSEILSSIRSQAPIHNPDQSHPKLGILKEEKNLKYSDTIIPQPSLDSNYKWRHQEEAVEKFLHINHGVLEMATGTGKTRTTLKILTRLFEENKIESIIISTVGNDLLDQWHKELLSWAIPRKFRVLRHYSSEHDLDRFILSPNQAILIISRQKLDILFQKLSSEIKAKTIIVHDEVHGLGSPKLQEQLHGSHQDFVYRLGLSATPEREYDQEGTEFIFKELGAVFFQFELKDAIERGILCEFDYIPLYCQLTKNDKARLTAVYTQEAQRKKQGQPMSKEEVWIKLAQVYKTAEEKPKVFADYLQQNSTILQSTIIFVEDQNYGQKILEIIADYTHRYRTYYSGQDSQSLKDFAKGEIDCLITCHRLSQGIDIPNLETVILFSSARAKLETIQRIGRCLRTDPENPHKRAKVIDFILQSEDNETIASDAERKDWLSELSRIRRKE